jgi:spore photoproduct lyase
MIFSHIYVESEIGNHPNTLGILERFKNIPRIEIDSYKHVFNRSNQNFQVQKSSPKLILAKKHENFLYPGSALTDQFQIPNFFYNTMVLNCQYNCDYCYLQGMYNSGHVVVFVNIEDFFQSVDDFLKTQSSMYLCISYDTDLLAFEKWLGYCRKWIEFSKERPTLQIEIRTKSNSFRELADLSPTENIILAWTLSPERVIKLYEKKTPSLNRRIENIIASLQTGWRTRICLDPVLFIKDWKPIYSELIHSIFSHPETKNIADLSLGTFRIHADYLKRIKKMRSDSDILYHPFRRNGSAFEYRVSIQEKIMNHLKSELEKYIPLQKVFT